MDQSKPFTYLGLKCIFQYMDVNRRIFLASRIPSLRNIHKAAPLNFDTLKLDKSSFTINHIKYSFITIIQKKRSSLVVSYDVDQFGDEEMYQTLSDGDILIGETREVYIDLPRRLKNSNEEKRQAQEKIGKDLETRKKLLEEVQQNLAGKYKPDVQKVLEPQLKDIGCRAKSERIALQNQSQAQKSLELLAVNLQQAIGKEQKNTHEFQLLLEKVNQEMDANRKSREELEQVMAKTKQKREALEKESKEYKQHMTNVNKNLLEIEENRRALEEIYQAMSKPVVYIQCGITSILNESQKFIRFPSEVKIRDALKQQIKNFLYGNHVLQVKHLEIDILSGVLRFPEGLKLKIRELSVQGDSIETIRPILDASSFALHKLSVQVKSQHDPVFKNEVLRSSKFLDIKVAENSNGFMVDALKKLPQKLINLSGRNFSPNEISVHIRNWKENPPIIGTKLTIQCEIGYANFVNNEQHPLNETSILRVYTANEPKNLQVAPREEWEKPGMLVLEVLPIGAP